MKFLISVLSVILPCFLAAGDLVSPNGHYAIEYLEVGPHEANVRLKNLQSGKVLGTDSSNGYRNASYLETASSPDSRYLAVIERGTKTTADVTVFSFTGNVVKRTRLPDYQLNLLGRRELVSGGRYHWASLLRWEGTKLTFYSKGQWQDGSGDREVQPGNWYDFETEVPDKFWLLCSSNIVVATFRVDGRVSKVGEFPATMHRQR